MKLILKITFALTALSLFFFCNNTVPEQPGKNELVRLVTDSTTVESTTPAMVADTNITSDELMGKFDPARHEDFTIVDQRYASQAGFRLRKAAYEAFQKMHSAAAREGIALKILSATRPFQHQKRIWEAKWDGRRKVDGQDLSKTIKTPTERALKILEYSSMPGTSRHHWGTDIDLNAFTNSYFEKGKGLKEYNWLVENAPRFGFCQPYSKKGAERMYGYNEEKWHWSYIPIAKKLTEQYNLRLKDEMISGFKGAETAVQIGIKKKYVLGINRECL